MATLNTLRTKGGWIVTIVIGLALLAFLIGDLAGGNSVFGVKEKVGKVDGTSVSYMDYARKVEEMTNLNKLLSGNEATTTEQQDQIRNHAWEAMINEISIYPGLDKLGIQVTDDEMFDRIYGNNVSPMLLYSGIFNNPQTGQFDKAALQYFVSNLDADPTGNSRAIWQYLQDQIRQEALFSKYQALLLNLTYVTGQEATRGAEQMNTYYNARYASLPYTAIPDSLVKISSSEVRKYYDEHRDMYKQTASRDLEYVVFEVEPSMKDFTDARSLVDEMTAEFEGSENLQQYVSLNSHDPFDPTYYTRDQLPSDLAEYAFNRNRTPVYGPMLETNKYEVIRVNDLRSFPDTLGVKQMVFPIAEKNVADSIFTVLGRNGDFDMLALQYSTNPGDADAGRVPTHSFHPEFVRAIQGTRDRWVKVELPDAIILLDVYYRGPMVEQVQLATLVYYVEPSSVTQQTAYAKASGFYTATAGLQDQFNKIAADSVYMKRVARVQSGQTQISGLENGREMIRWAFNAKPGAISSIMEIDNNYVIATLVSAREDGYAPVDQVKDQIASMLIREKKADQLVEKMKGGSIDALASSHSASTGELSDINYRSFYIPEVGLEPALIGAVCGGIPEGQLSRPIKGLAAVYVAEITSKEVREETTAEVERVRLEAQGQQYGMNPFAALVELSQVVDGRSKYF